MKLRPALYSFIVEDLKQLARLGYLFSVGSLSSPCNAASY